MLIIQLGKYLTYIIGSFEPFVNGSWEISRIASTASVCTLAKILVPAFRMACYIASTSGVATLEDFSSLGYPKPLVFQAKRKVEMEEKKRNIRIDQDGTRHAPVPMWQESPQITVRLEEGNTTYRFTGSFDGKHTLPEKAVKLADEQKGV